jgi:hypothetical protein
MPVRTRRGAADAEPVAEAEARQAEEEAVVSGDVDGGDEDEGEDESEEGEGESEENDVEGEELSDEDDEVDSSDEDIVEEGPDGEEGEEEAAEDDSDAEAVRKSATALSIAGAAVTNGTAAAAETDSEDEMPLNTIGNVPLEWYDDFDHVGYDLEGRKILRSARQDELDALIRRFDDPDASRTIHDALHGVDVVLSKDDVALIKRLQRRKYPGANFDPYPETVPFDYPDGKIHPLSNAPPRKAPFLPSKDEAKTVMRLVMAMRSEQYQKSVANRRAQDAKAKPDYQYLIWDDPTDEEIKHHKRLPAPKLALPGNAESYNPPKEYLFTPEERAAWEKMDPSDRPINFVPQAFSAMRRVPQYEPLINERFERCLDLYLCPREAKTKLDIDPDSLIPQLPSPAELRPFPERLSNRFLGHTGRVYSVSVSPSGEWLLSAAADGALCTPACPHALPRPSALAQAPALPRAMALPLAMALLRAMALPLARALPRAMALLRAMALPREPRHGEKVMRHDRCVLFEPLCEALKPQLSEFCKSDSLRHTPVYFPPHALHSRHALPFPHAPPLLPLRHGQALGSCVRQMRAHLPAGRRSPVRPVVSERGHRHRCSHRGCPDGAALPVAPTAPRGRASVGAAGVWGGDG